MRRGNNAYYDESKMKPGEMAVATDTRQAYVGMGNGDAEELAFKRDLEDLGGGGGGTSDHTQLTNRNIADQHPISAITGLQKALDAAAASASTDMALLWENASPTSEFGAHEGDNKIFIDNESDYKEFYVWLQYHPTLKRRSCIRVQRGYAEIVYAVTRAEVALRDIASVDGGFEFGEGRVTAFNAPQYNTGNIVWIPLAIYGVK